MEIARFFKDNYYYSIAIYGMGVEGKKFFEELRNTDIQVKFAIDKNAENIMVEDLTVVPIEMIDSRKQIDAIVVTPIKYFAEIEAMLEKVYQDLDIISLEDVRKYELMIENRGEST